MNLKYLLKKYKVKRLILRFDRSSTKIYGEFDATDKTITVFWDAHLKSTIVHELAHAAEWVENKNLEHDQRFRKREKWIKKMLEFSLSI